MTFVYPFLLGGLLLAGLPVLLHFLVRQKPKTLPFPAFRFLMLKRRSNTRNLRLRHLLLLLLRIALLMLLCLALARPRLFHESLGISRERPVALVLVFDTSPSMAYKSGDMTRLDLAKKRSLELLDQLPADCRVLMLDSADAGNFGRADWLKSMEMARRRIKGLTIRPESAPVTRAMNEAFGRFDDWDRSGDDPLASQFPRLICIFTDRTQASWDATALTKRQSADDAVKVQTLLFDVGIDDPVDLAITQLKLPASERGGMQQSFAAGEKITLRAVVKATGKSNSISNAYTLICQLGDSKLQQHFVVQAGEQQTVTLQIDTDELKLKPGLHQVEVKLETGDLLPFNNQRYLTFAIREPQQVLVLADDVKKPAIFVRALEACLYKVDVRSVHDKKDHVSRDYAAIFLEGVADPTELWKSLADYVQQGGGVGIIPGGDEMKLSTYNSDAAKTVMPAILKQKVKVSEKSEEGQAWRQDPFLGDLDHPMMRRGQTWFAGDFDITKNPRRANQYWRAVPLPGKDISVVVRYDDGTPMPAPALIERTWPKAGKVLLLTTPMEEHQPPWNNYHSKLNTFYLALTTLCARHLCPETDNPTLNHRFGSAPPTVRQKQPFQKYRLTGPSVNEEISFDDRGLWIGDRLPRPGNYVVSGSSGEEQTVLAKFSVNVPGEESDLSRVPVRDIEAVLGKDTVVPQDRKTSLPATMNWDEPVELFPWLMLAFLFFLALENLLANKFYRQDPA